MSVQLEKIKSAIRKNLEQFGKIAFAPKRFIPGKTPIQYSGTVYNEEEIIAMVNSILGGWFGVAEKTDEFEKKVAKLLGNKWGVMTNSGSSASLLTIAVLKSRNYSKHLRDGDEVITTASTFSTTFNPIIQHNLKPVLVDIDLGTYNLNLDNIEKAISSRTRAIMFAHTLGNPVDMYRVMTVAKKYKLFVIEDCCDALGAKFDNKLVGSFGDLATLSLYPAHHITTGEGGMVAGNDFNLEKIVRSLRDWGRACQCRGRSLIYSDGVCGRRFDRWIEDFEEIFDHKYIFSEIGYNLKPVEFQAAMGLIQIERIKEFERIRKKNFRRLYETFLNYKKFFILPQWHKKAEPSWFSFPLTVKAGIPFSRADIIHYYEKHVIQTRPLFSGNILRQPGYKHIRGKCRVMGDLKNSDEVMRRTFFLGIYPGITNEMMDYVIEITNKFMKKYKSH